jgi:two-component system nitrogen regulation response regulator GlnG
VRASLEKPTPPASASAQSDFWDQFVDEQWKANPGRLYDRALARMETEMIVRVLRRTEGNQVEAARVLGLSRTTLRAKIRELGIAIDRVVHSDDVTPQDDG